MSNDNGKEIYFDKNLDKTYYEIIDEYKSELDQIPVYQDKLDFLSKFSDKTECQLIKQVEKQKLY